MVKEFSVRVLLRDEEIEILRTEYESTNETLIRRGMVSYGSFEEYLGAIADGACRQRVEGILDAETSGVEI